MFAIWSRSNDPIAIRQRPGQARSDQATKLGAEKRSDGPALDLRLQRGLQGLQ